MKIFSLAFIGQWKTARNLLTAVVTIDRCFFFYLVPNGKTQKRKEKQKPLPVYQEANFSKNFFRNRCSRIPSANKICKGKRS